MLRFDPVCDSTTAALKACQLGPKFEFLPLGRAHFGPISSFLHFTPTMV